jgi:hypothetical protein
MGRRWCDICWSIGGSILQAFVAIRFEWEHAPVGSTPGLLL